MQIILNDHAYLNNGGSDQTIQQLADKICSTATDSEAQIIASLVCDGVSVEDDRLQEILEYPLNRYQCIEIRTVSIREQVAAALSQAIEVLRNSTDIREAVADCLNQGRHEAAMTEMRRLLDAIRQVQQTTILACQILGIDPTDIRGQGMDFNAILDDVRKSLTDLKNSMESQDFVLVSDLLRYELNGPLEGWITILNQLYELATAKN